MGFLLIFLRAVSTISAIHPAKGPGPLCASRSFSSLKFRLAQLSLDVKFFCFFYCKSYDSTLFDTIRHFKHSKTRSKLSPPLSDQNNPINAHPQLSVPAVHGKINPATACHFLQRGIDYDSRISEIKKNTFSGR